MMRRRQFTDAIAGAGFALLMLAALTPASQSRSGPTDAAGTCRTDPCPCTAQEKSRGKVDTSKGCRCPAGHTETKIGKCIDYSNAAKRIAELEQFAEGGQKCSGGQFVLQALVRKRPKPAHRDG
jgi:hypothetical protein